jgi:hypothetical protein
MQYKVKMVFNAVVLETGPGCQCQSSQKSKRYVDAKDTKDTFLVAPHLNHAPGASSDSRPLSKTRPIEREQLYL